MRFWNVEPPAREPACVVESDEGLAAVGAEPRRVELCRLRCTRGAAPIRQLSLRSRRSAVLAGDELAVGAAAVDEVSAWRVLPAVATGGEVPLAVALPATPVSQRFGRLRFAAVRASGLVLATVVAELWSPIASLILLPAPDHRGAALSALVLGCLRVLLLKPSGVDIVRHLIEVVEPAEELLVLAEHPQPLVRGGTLGVPQPVAVEGIPERALHGERQVTPHVLPVALGLIPVGSPTELERELALLNERRKVPAVRTCPRVGELAGDENHEEHRGDGKQFLLFRAQSVRVVSGHGGSGEHRRPYWTRVPLQLPGVSVDDPDILVRVDHDVLRVDVAEQDVEGMQVGDLLQEGNANVDEIRLRPVGVSLLEPGGPHDRRLEFLPRGPRHGVADELTVAVRDEACRETDAFPLESARQEQGQLLLAVPCPVFGVEDLDDAVRRTVDCVDSPLAALTEHRTEHKCPGVSASRREAHGIPGRGQDCAPLQHAVRSLDRRRGVEGTRNASRCSDRGALLPRRSARAGRGDDRGDRERLLEVGEQQCELCDVFLVLVGAKPLLDTPRQACVLAQGSLIQGLIAIHLDQPVLGENPGDETPIRLRCDQPNSQPQSGVVRQKAHLIAVGCTFEDLDKEVVCIGVRDIAEVRSDESRAHGRVEEHQGIAGLLDRAHALFAQPGGVDQTLLGQFIDDLAWDHDGILVRTDCLSASLEESFEPTLVCRVRVHEDVCVDEQPVFRLHEVLWCDRAHRGFYGH